MEAMQFGTLQLQRVGDRVLIEGPKEYLSALKKYLELRDCRSAGESA
jgi:hypothetical protein